MKTAKFDVLKWTEVSERPKNFTTVVVSSCGHSVVCLYCQAEDTFLRLDGGRMPAHLVDVWTNLPQY